MLNPTDLEAQVKAFKSGALSVSALLNHRFVDPVFRASRELDPIVGVSFTGLFDFFVEAFGPNWLRWWEAGRPEQWWSDKEDRQFAANVCYLLEYFKEYPGYDEVENFGNSAAGTYRFLERSFLTLWRKTVEAQVRDYCERHGLRAPNRCTTVQPAGTKSLLSNASPGWHPPKAQRFIRRITFRRDHPVALACRDQGYSIIPSQSDKDENGMLLIDPYDPRCTEWLVEMPIQVPWANIPGTDQFRIEGFSALAQLDFYFQVQRYYTRHNTSATIELYRHEQEAVAERIHQAIVTNEGYISVTLLERSEDTFPRMPFERIPTQEQYEALCQQVRERCVEPDFYKALAKYETEEEEAPLAACSSQSCELPAR